MFSVMHLLFPAFQGYIISPSDSPYQFTQRVNSGKQNIEYLRKHLIQICDWCSDNFRDKSWNINEIAIDDHADIYFVFNFANAEDAMAFKLKWM